MLVLLLGLASLQTADAFLPHGHRAHRHPLRTTRRAAGADDDPVSVRTVSEAEVDERGMRDWPLTAQPKSFSDRYTAGEELFVQEGSAELRVSEFLDAKEELCETVSLKSGLLLTVNQDCAIEWKVTEPLVLLTPTFQDSGAFLAVIAVSVAFGAFAVFGGVL